MGFCHASLKLAAKLPLTFNTFNIYNVLAASGYHIWHLTGSGSSLLDFVSAWTRPIFETASKFQKLEIMKRAKTDTSKYLVYLNPRFLSEKLFLNRACVYIC